ncbi:MAG TPA: HEAT repeat domain-containing protein [Thiolinea sp.]|jgi:hypothetical protein|nr:HEAT repeat domain-containing protein [uncultured Thiothrix sp.]HMT94926.1 HEAT repeat domain-containing protein [Thiolinea sp.]
MLKTKNVELQKNSLQVLRLLKAEGITDTIIPLLNNKDFDIRTNAAKFLGHTGDRKAISELIILLKNDNEAVLPYVAQALGQLNAKEVIPDLLLLLKNRIDNFDLIAEALGALDTKVAIPELITVLKESSNNTNLRWRWTVEKSLHQLTAKEAVAITLDDIQLDYNYFLDSDSLNKVPISHFNLPQLKVNFYTELDHYFDHISDISGGELIEFTLRRLSMNDKEIKIKAMIALLRLKNNGLLNKLQLKIIDKALKNSDNILVKAAEKFIFDQKKKALKKTMYRLINPILKLNHLASLN